MTLLRPPAFVREVLAKWSKRRGDMVVGLVAKHARSGFARMGQVLHGPRPSGKRELGVFSPPSTNWQNVAKDDNLAENAAELKRRRGRLQALLPSLSRRRADTLRLNSNAIALGRAGKTYQDPRTMTLLGEAEVMADDAMRSAEREIRQLDEEIGRASDGAFGTRVKRSARSRRVDE